MTRLAERRRFIKHGIAGGLLLSSSGSLIDEVLASIPVSGEVLPFINEGSAPLDTITGAGLKGRLALDHSTLTADDLIVPNDKFFIRTRYPGKINPEAVWTIQFAGPGFDKRLTIADIASLEKPMGLQLLECSGNSPYRHFGLISVADWSGVLLKDLFDYLKIDTGQSWVQVNGFDEHTDLDPGSTPGAAWIFSWQSLEDAGAFLALKMNGETLPKDHGFPVRLIVPNWYGCSNIKWVNEIRLVNADADATSQMVEYSGRTHQKGVPQKASEYEPALIDLAALPIRVEKMNDRGLYYKVTGLQWGRDQPSSKLSIAFTKDGPPTPITTYSASNRRWSLWEYNWRPQRKGDHTIFIRCEDNSIRTRRLDLGYYRRTVTIEEV